MDRQASHKSTIQHIGNSFGSTGVERERISTHRKCIWIGRRRAETHFSISENHFDRRASSGSTLDRRAKTPFSILGDADHAFRSTSAEPERNYTSSRRGDQNSMCISLDKRRVRAKPWWGQIEPPFVPISVFSQNVARNSLPTPKHHLSHSDPEAIYTF